MKKNLKKILYYRYRRKYYSFKNISIQTLFNINNINIDKQN